MPLRQYDMQDLELIKAAPRTLGEDGYRALAVGEFWFREKKQFPQHVLVMVHGYLRRAHEAYERNSKKSPWFLGKFDYERHPVELKPVEPVYVPPPPAPIVEVPLPATMRPATVELHQQILGFCEAFGGKAALWRLKKAMEQYAVDSDKVDRAVQKLAKEGYLEATGRGYYAMTDKAKQAAAKG